MAADVQLVLCAPLCFLVSRIHSLETELLHCGLFGHYTGESITAAKKRLKDDIDNMKLTIKVLRLPDRRDSDNRKENEVNDLIKLMKFLDNEKLLDKLPKYVADNPDAMPCFRIVDGDFRHLIHRMNAMEAMLSSVYAILNHITVPSNLSYSNAVSYAAAPQITHIQSGPSVDQHRVGFLKQVFHAWLKTQHWPSEIAKVSCSGRLFNVQQANNHVRRLMSRKNVHAVTSH